MTEAAEENEQYKVMLTLIVCPRLVGYISSTSCFMAAVPRNKSNCVPGGSKPDRTHNYLSMKDITGW